MAKDRGWHEIPIVLWCVVALMRVTAAYVNENEICKQNNTGTEYVGKINKTVQGYNCKRWDMIPLPMGNPNKEGTSPTAKDLNYCRNPDEEPEGPWCFTTDPNVMWDRCPVPTCEEYYEEAKKTTTTTTTTTTTKAPTTMTSSQAQTSTTVRETEAETEPETEADTSTRPEVTSRVVNLVPGSPSSEGLVTERRKGAFSLIDQASSLDEFEAEEAPGAVYIGSFGLFMVLLFLSFLFILDLTTYYGNLRFLYENLQDFFERPATPKQV